MRKITKAVFPVAGMGTRFLPATKASPKEMLPIVDKPLIQYAVEEALAAGVTDLVFITGRTKRSIEDHFDKAYEMETELEARGKTKLLEMVRSIIPSHASCIFIRQVEALGLGHAVLMARPVINDDPFAVMLADDLIDGQGRPPVMRQMVELYDYYQCSVLGVQMVAPQETSQYGIVDAQPLSDRIHKISGLVEKPNPAEAPSTLGVVGRYILAPRVFHHLENARAGAGGEIQLTDAIAALLKEQQVLAYEFEGIRYDCGSKLGYLKATVEYALKHGEVGDAFRQYLTSVVPGGAPENG
ncbi:MAG: UTP--glucose-1-phosphate uridylyltransferase GalU [Betaproteobacteria bacterium]|nr:UTP--glucose-1-phosphate uridylyltransferase GalU [Betaproteobacteria bacterium]